MTGKASQILTRWGFRSPALALLTAGAICFSAPAVFAHSGRQTVDSLIDTLSKAGTIDERASCEATRYIDYETMAEVALGKPQWAKLSSTQQHDFVAALRRLVEHRYYKRWQRIFENGKLSHLSESKQGSDIRVISLLIVGKKKDRLTWRLASREGDLRIISLAVGDRDLLTRVGERLRTHLNRKGIVSLIAWLREESHQG